MIEWCHEKWLFSQLSSEQTTYWQVLHTVWYISGERLKEFYFRYQSLRAIFIHVTFVAWYEGAREIVVLAKSIFNFLVFRPSDRIFRSRWFVGNKKPTILCARSTSSKSERSKKCRSRSENIRKGCLFYSQNNKIVWISKIADKFIEKFTRCAKVCGIFSWMCFLRADWLGRQTPITWHGKRHDGHFSPGNEHSDWLVASWGWGGEYSWGFSHSSL